MYGYNHSYHRSIKMKPVDVTKENESIVFKTLHGVKNKLVKETIFKYKISDLVRISRVRGPFTKGYEEKYTHGFFTISDRIHWQPPVYRLKDYDGDIIQGCFYEQELQKINVSGDKTFKVEKILDKKTG